MITDYQAHWYTQAYLDSILDRKQTPRAERTTGDYEYYYYFDDEPLGGRWPVPRRFVDIEMYIADMDENGVDVSTLSPNMIGDVTRFELGEARETVDLLNEETARIQKEFPERVLGLAMLPMQDPDAAIAALDRAIGALGLKGVCIISHIAGRPIAGPDTLPIYKRIEELGVPIVLHPSNRSMVFEAVRDVGMAAELGLGWIFETSVAALSLIYSGTLDECPNLTVVHPHAGGVLPYMIGRIDNSRSPQYPKDRGPVVEYLRKNFYADTAMRTPGAVEMAIRTYGIDRVVFGSDFPWMVRGEQLAFVRNDLGSVTDQVLGNQIPTLTRGAGEAVPTASGQGAE